MLPYAQAFARRLREGGPQTFLKKPSETGASQLPAPVIREGPVETCARIEPGSWWQLHYLVLRRVYPSAQMMFILLLSIFDLFQAGFSSLMSFNVYSASHNGHIVASQQYIHSL